MNSVDQGLCPIPGLGHCLYDRCPYWDAVRQECDASCLQEQLEREATPTADGFSLDSPCTIPWTEDWD